MKDKLLSPKKLRKLLEAGKESRMAVELDLAQERIAELEEKARHWEDTCHAQAENTANIEDECNRLKAENERLKEAISKWMSSTEREPENFFERYFIRKGLERAAEIVENHEEPNLRGYVRDSLIQAIRAEITETIPNTPTQEGQTE